MIWYELDMQICCNIHVICDSIANNPIKSIAILCNRIVILNRLVGELVATKALPKPASEKTLQRKYKILATATKGRIDIDTDSGQKLSELVHMYCAAFTNLYGTLTVREAWDIFCKVEPDLVRKGKIRKKDFIAFTDILRAEDLPYYVFEIDELYSGESAGEPADRELVNKALVHHGMNRFYYYFELLDAQGDKPFCVLEKEKYRAWANLNCFRKSQQAVDMMNFLEHLTVSGHSENEDVDGNPIRGKKLKNFIFWSKSERFYYEYAKRDWEKAKIAARCNVIASEKLMREIERYIQLGDIRISTAERIKWLSEDLDEIGVELSKSQFEKFVKLFMELNNKSRLWCNRGWTPKELSMMNANAGMPSISFGPGIQAAFANGEIDKEELIKEIKKKGFQVIE